MVEYFNRVGWTDGLTLDDLELEPGLIDVEDRSTRIDEEGNRHVDGGVSRRELDGALVASHHQASRIDLYID